MGHIAVGLSHSVTELFFFFNMKLKNHSCNSQREPNGPWLSKCFEMVECEVEADRAGKQRCSYYMSGSWYVRFCQVGRKGWVVDVITRLQLLVDITATGQLRAAARSHSERQRESERGEFSRLWEPLASFLFFFKSLCVFLHLFLFLNSFRENRPVS